MATAVIIGNGLFPRKEYPRYLIQTADLRVCCDGALKTYLRNGFPLPDAVVGDSPSPTGNGMPISSSRKASRRTTTRPKPSDGSPETGPISI